MPFSRYEACLGTKTVLTTIRDDLIDPSLLPSGPVVSSVASSSSRRPSTSPPAADPEHAAQGTGEYPEPPTSFQAVMAPRPYPPASYARFLLPAPALEAEMTPERPSISRSRSRSPSPAAQKRRKVSEEPPKTGGNSYQYRCYNCQETFSKRYTISSRHFVACVRDRGLPDGVFWDSDPSCWELGSNGPSGKPVRGVEVAKAYHARNQGKHQKERKGPSIPAYMGQADEWRAKQRPGSIPEALPDCVVKAEKWKKANPGWWPLAT